MATNKKAPAKKAAPKKAAPKKAATKKAADKKENKQIERSISNGIKLGFANPFTTFTQQQVDEVKKKIELGKHSHDIKKPYFK